MIKIINWDKYQSYKDRRPPWIRFHRTTLDDFGFQSMTADSRALLPMLWLLACEYEDPKAGCIDADIKEIAFRLRIPAKVVTACINELQASDFIECIETVTKPLRDRNETVPPETETETETETEAKKHFDIWYDLYPKKDGPKYPKKAYLKIIKNGEATPEDLLEGLKKYNKHLKNNKTERRFMKGAAAWLNEGRWQAVLDDKKKGSPQW